MAPREIDRPGDVAFGKRLSRLRIDQDKLRGFVRKSLFHVGRLYKVDGKICGFGSGISKTLLPKIILSGRKLRHKHENSQRQGRHREPFSKIPHNNLPKLSCSAPMNWIRPATKRVRADRSTIRF